MKVLFVSEYGHPNSVVKSYFDGISPHCELAGGLINFWHGTLKYDIIHIQWPEELFNWHLFGEDDMQRLEQRFEYWKSSGARFVITRHNTLPHGVYYLYEPLFELCYKYSDAIIHLGAFSLEEFLAHDLYSKKINVIINHPNYLNIPNTVTKEDAVKKMHLPLDSVIYLSFGAIRYQREQDDLVQAFKKLKVRKKKLILTNSLYLKKIVPFRVSPIKAIRYKIKKIRLQRQGIFIDENRNINDSSIQNYFKAADIVIIPRIHQLNSGLIYLAFSFSKIVVGPNISNIGSLLKKTGNILYTPGDIDSYVDALERASKLPGGDKGKTNYEYVVHEGDMYKIGREHVALYEKVMNENHSGQ